MKLKKRQIIIIILTFVLGIILISVGLIMNKKQDNQEIPNTTPSSGELLGEEREKAQEKIIKVIEMYLKNEEKIKEYLDKKGNKTISMQEIKEELNVDISEFEKLEYKCNNNFTTIDYNDDYSEHVITLTCEELFKK